jgi:hypothetical protein
MASLPKSILFVASLTSSMLTGTLALADEPDVPRPAAERTGRGPAIGLDNGIMGRAYEQGLRVRIPIFQHFAIGLRGLSTFGERAGDIAWYVGGRAEIVGHSPVYLDHVRLYGGGGPEVITRVQGSGGDKTSVGGGGQFGFEFFFGPSLSFFAEIGGHSGDDLTAGGTALAGLMLYPFTGP